MQLRAVKYNDMQVVGICYRLNRHILLSTKHASDTILSALHILSHLLLVVTL